MRYLARGPKLGKAAWGQSELIWRQKPSIYALGDKCRRRCLEVGALRL